MNPEVDLELVERVRDVVHYHTRVTPLLYSPWLSERVGGEVYLKCENLQRTGSFKVRGALAALSLLGDEERSHGVVTASAGNHGMGLARAAAVFGVPCTVVVPRSAALVKEEGIRNQGARVMRSPHDGYDETQAWTLQRMDELHGCYVSAFEDAGVIAGNGGTTMTEILDQLPGVETVVAPCGGGGLSVGLGVVARALSPGTRIVGVNTDASPGMWLSRRDDRPHLTLSGKPTIAEGLEGGIGEMTFRLGKTFIDDLVVVSETKLRRTVVEIARRERMIVEGSAAAGAAALLEGKIDPGRTCVILSGSNIDMDLFQTLLAESSK